MKVKSKPNQMLASEFPNQHYQVLVYFNAFIK